MLCTGTGRVVVRIVRVSLVHVKESHLFAAVSKPSKVQVCKGKEVAPQLCAAYVQRMCSEGLRVPQEGEIVVLRGGEQRVQQKRTRIQALPGMDDSTHAQVVPATVKQKRWQEVRRCVKAWQPQAQQ